MASWLVDDQLRAKVEVLNRVLPDERFVVALVLNDARQAVLFNLFSRDPLGHVVHTVADGAGIGRRRLIRAQADAALRAGKLHSVGLLRQRVNRFMADRAARLFALDWSNTTMFPQCGHSRPASLSVRTLIV